MDFEKDVFISYAHIDDVAEEKNDEGWITKFHRYLEVRLQKFLGKVNIWRDERLTGNEIFSPEIESQLPKNKVMVSVITPNYVKSDWCKREIEGFYKSAVANGFLSVGSKSRIFKVVPNPVDQNEIENLPTDFKYIFKEILDYQFYIKEVAKNRIVTLDKRDDIDKEIVKEYNEKLDDVVNDIANLIKQINNPDKTNLLKKKIYLAETTNDLRSYREKLARALEANNLIVLPNIKLPDDVNDFNAKVEDFLDQCILSVHMVSSTNYALVPEGADKSIVILQNEIAAKKSATKNLKRLIWISPAEPDAKVNPLQTEFLNKLNNDKSESAAGVEILKGTLDEFTDSIKTNIKAIEDAEKLKIEAEEKAKKAAEMPPANGTGINAEVKRIYIICNEADLETSRPLEKLIQKNGYTVIVPNFDREPKVLIDEHNENLKICDAIIIYYGTGNFRWVGKMIGDISRLARNPQKPLLVTALYTTGADDDGDKKDYTSPDVLKIDGLSGFAPENFENFFQKLK